MLRYFATNRGMETLAGSVLRDTRTKLEQGGYFFVDMKKYMSYYFAVTDEENIPPASLELKSKDSVFGEKFLGSAKVGTVVICVHGFNVELREASTWFRILTDTMRHDPQMAHRFVVDPDDEADRQRIAQAPDGGLTGFIGFSWPSAGNAYNYYSDQSRATASAAALANLIMRCRLQGKRVKLLCHSMGNYVACHMLKALIRKEILPPDLLDPENAAKLAPLLQELDRAKPSSEQDQIRGEVARTDFLIDCFVMIAPDVERRHVTKVYEDIQVAAGERRRVNEKASDRNLAETYVGPFYAGLQHLCGRVVNVYSRFDGALNISNTAQSTKEAGLAARELASTLSFGLVPGATPDQRWEMRLGSVPHPFNAPPNFTSVNATELAGRKIDHSDHIDCPELVQRIGRELGM